MLYYVNLILRARYNTKKRVQKEQEEKKHFKKKKKAYENLSEGLKATLLDMKAVHTGEP